MTRDGYAFADIDKVGNPQMSFDPDWTSPEVLEHATGGLGSLALVAMGDGPVRFAEPPARSASHCSGCLAQHCIERLRLLVVVCRPSGHLLSVCQLRAGRPSPSS